MPLVVAGVIEPVLSCKNCRHVSTAHRGKRVPWALETSNPFACERCVECNPPPQTITVPFADLNLALEGFGFDDPFDEQDEAFRRLAAMLGWDVVE